MATFSIAFMTPEVPSKLIHKMVSSENEPEALRKFFAENATSFYSNDDKGFHYFQEDFTDSDSPLGNIIPIH